MTFHSGKNYLYINKDKRCMTSRAQKTIFEGCEFEASNHFGHKGQGTQVRNSPLIQL